MKSLDGRLLLVEGNPKEEIDKNLLKEIKLTNILYFIATITPLILTYLIFNSCIDKNKLNLNSTITLGSIFATFGSAIISIVILIENEKLNRILSNVDILYSDILQEEKWTRWPFLKRYNAKTLLDGKITTNRLENPNILFKLGTHDITITVPTTQEDFYDLPTVYTYKQMHKYDQQFKTYIINHKDCISDTPFSDIGNYFFAWDCLYDIWKNIILFKINKLIVRLGFSIIISSFIYSFTFIYINNLINSLINLINLI